MLPAPTCRQRHPSILADPRVDPGALLLFQDSGILLTAYNQRPLPKDVLDVCGAKKLENIGVILLCWAPHGSCYHSGDRPLAIGHPTNARLMA